MIDLPIAVEPGDVLSQSTRARLFALLSEMKRSAGTAELAQRLGLHPNGVRIHLERLEQEGLLRRSHAKHGRGRPADAWTIAPDARPGGEDPRAYRDLGRWLARAMRSGRGGLRAVEASAREIGRELAPGEHSGPAPTSSETAFETALSSLGFQPQIQSHDQAHMILSLANCPYREAVRENQPLVCALHKGLTRGLLDALAPQAELAGFSPRDPDKAGCLIELRLSASSAAQARARRARAKRGAGSRSPA